MILEILARTASECSSGRWRELLQQLVAIEKGGCMTLPLLNCPLLTLHWLWLLSDLSVNTCSINSSTHQKTSSTKKVKRFLLGYEAESGYGGTNVCHSYWKGHRGSRERERWSRIPFGSRKLLN